jgi:transposase
VATQRTYRKFTTQQKLEIVLAGLRGDRSIRDVCREHGIAETLYYSWRDKLLEGGKQTLAGKEERASERDLKKRIRELERALGRKTYELEIAGEHCGTWTEDARRQVPRAGRQGAKARGRGARDADQPAGDLPKPRRAPQRCPPKGPVDRAIVEVAKQNPTDGTRMVAALTSREIGKPVNRKRTQRVMREQRLLQRHRSSGRRRRPASFGSSAPVSSGTWI